MVLMHKAENYIHTNNRKKKIKEKHQITEFAHFKTIIWHQRTQFLTGKLTLYSEYRSRELFKMTLKIIKDNH